jgi:hypothetical protein
LAGQSNRLNIGATPLTLSNVVLDFNVLGGGAIADGTTFTLITAASPINAAAYGLTLGSNGQILSGLSIDNYGIFGPSGSGYTSGSYLFVSGDNIDLYVVPEPSTVALCVAGLAGLALWRRGRKRGAGIFRATCIVFALGVAGWLVPAHAASYAVTDTLGDLSAGSLGGDLQTISSSGSTTTNTITFSNSAPITITLAQNDPTITEASGDSLTIAPTNTVTISGGTYTAFNLQGAGTYNLQNLNITGSGTGIGFGVGTGTYAVATVLNLTNVNVASNVFLGSAPTAPIIYVAASSTATFSGSVTGTPALGLYQKGPGTLILSGSNNFGSIQVQNGVVSVSSDANLGPNPAKSLLLDNNGTLYTSKGFTTARNIIVGAASFMTSGTIAVAPGQTTTFTGTISTQRLNVLDIAGGGTVVLTGTTNQITTGITVTGSSTLLAGNGSNGSVVGAGTGSITVQSGSAIGGAGAFNTSSFAVQSGASIIVGTGTDTASQTTFTGTSASTITGAKLVFNLGSGATAGQSNTLNLGATPLTLSNVVLDFNVLGGGAIADGTTFTLITASSPINAAAYGLTLGSNGQIISGLSIDNYGIFGPSGSGYTSGSYLFVSGDNIDLYVVPEPSTVALCVAGLAVLALWRRGPKRSASIFRATSIVFALGVVESLTPAKAATYPVTTTAGDLSAGSLGGDLQTISSSGSTTNNTITFSNSAPITITLAQNNPTVTEASGNSLTIAPTSTVTMSGGTYTAFTFQGTGTFNLQNLNITGSGTGINIGSSSTGSFTSNQSYLNLNNVNVFSNIILGPTASPVITVAASSTATFSGNVTSNSSFGISESGPGTLVLSGTNHSSRVQVSNGGTVSVASDANLGSNPSGEGIYLNNGTLYTSKGFTTSRSVTINSIGATGTATYGTLSVASGQTTTFSGTITNHAEYLNIVGGGTVVLTGTNNQVGLLVNFSDGSTLSVSDAGNLNGNSGLVLIGGTLQFTGTKNPSIFGGIGISGTSTINIVNAAETVTTSFGYPAGGFVSPGSLNITGSGTLSDTALASAMTGSLTVTGATLLVTSDGAFGSNNGAVTLNGGRIGYNNEVFPYGGSLAVTHGIVLGTNGGILDSTNANISDSGTITGSGSLTIAGVAGTNVTLSGSNIYTGGTTVTNSATLLAANGTNGSATGTGSLTVVSGATIGGAGTFSTSNFAVQSGASIIVGTGTDTTSQTTLTGTSASTITGAKLVFNLGSGALAGQSNQLNIGATPLTLSNVVLDFNVLGGGVISAGTTYTLITTSNAITASAYGLTLGSNGQIISGLGIDNYGLFGTPTNGYSSGFYPGSYLFVSGDNIDLYVVPEPSTVALCVAGLAGLALWRRTRPRGA